MALNGCGMVTIAKILNEEQTLLFRIPGDCQNRAGWTGLYNSPLRSTRKSRIVLLYPSGSGKNGHRGLIQISVSFFSCYPGLVISLRKRSQSFFTFLLKSVSYASIVASIHHSDLLFYTSDGKIKVSKKEQEDRIISTVRG